MTKGSVEALSSFLGDDKVEILLSTTKRSRALRLYEMQQKEESIRNDREREVYSKNRKFFKTIGAKYGPANGKKVGAYARDSGHLRRLRETKVICENGHRSNLQHYRSYCRHNGLDPEKSIILPYDG
jgi:hypothetical protein